MSQPVWKHVGSIGDRDPIAYGGGFIYEDTTGVYAPEVAYFEPASDEDWHKTEGKTPLTVYRFSLERDPTAEWWYEHLDDIASFTGRTLEECQADAVGTLTAQAWLYDSLIHYYGIDNFDSYPIEMTEDEAYAQYKDEMDVSLGRKSAQ